MVFNSYTFIVFFCPHIYITRPSVKLENKKDKPVDGQLYFLCRLESTFYFAALAKHYQRLFCGQGIIQPAKRSKKRLLLVVSLIGNLGMLCFFKYGGFLLENFTAFVNVFGTNFHPAKPNIILPPGISFYTFTTLCYTIDMYHKKSKPVKSLLDFSLFVTFFPHLVAGPIVRPPQVVPQFETERNSSLQLFIHDFNHHPSILTLGRP